MDDKYNTLRSMKAAKALGMSAQELMDATERGKTIAASSLELLEVREITSDAPPTISVDANGKRHIFAIPVVERHVETVIETKVDHNKFVTKEAAGGLPWVCLPAPDGQDIPLAPILPGIDGPATAKRQAISAVRAVLSTTKAVLQDTVSMPSAQTPPATSNRPPTAIKGLASTGAAAPPPPPPAAPAPVAPSTLCPAKVEPHRMYTVTASALYGPSASSAHQYLAFSLKNPTGGAVQLKFLRNAKDDDAARQWDFLLGMFVQGCGLDGIRKDSEELHGKVINLYCAPGTYAGLCSVSTALGVDP
ncbi:hypothetical protein [Leisingera sp. ANG59]|uniref:hypothetical protein n=1 Tax=Leisingera sp. ANG59 TaxID=2675221 RepID=UPI001573D877|nr:hypothetical protein [Leisingera sp. ANG59]NSY41583.1 hypothetical protein [Leisingera sp. ANG59]